MTTDIQLYRPDTGEFPPVRVLDPGVHASAPYSRAVGLLDRWVRDSRRAADEFAAWIEGQTAQARAEMRQLCDELDLPITFAEYQVPWMQKPTEAEIEMGREIRAALSRPALIRGTYIPDKPAETADEYMEQDDIEGEPWYRRTWAAITRAVLRLDAWAERIGEDKNK